MIFVTVGTSSWKFDRLIKEMDRIAGSLDEEILIQTGASDYIPKHAKHFKFLPKSEVEKYFNEARLIVSHAGAGTILNTLKIGKPIIVVPRLEKIELWDNHQIELAEELASEGKIKAVYDINKLETEIRCIDEKTTNISMHSETKLNEVLREYLMSYKKAQLT